jgi:hypothetical protein
VTAENVTWQNVRVHGVMLPAYVTGCTGSGCGSSGNPGATFKFRNVIFSNFEGQSRNSRVISCPQLAGAQCDIQFHDFNVKVVS